MFRYYALKSFISICLFSLFLILPCTEIENANAMEYQPVSHNELVNIENLKDRAQMVQGIFDFSFGGKEKNKKDGVASRINKKDPMQQRTRTKKNVSGAKGLTPTRSFLDGGPLPSMTSTKKKEKKKKITKPKKLSLPTFGDK
jgi:hypothetical protein